MTHTISITDGVTTVDLSASNVQLNRYTPKSPQWDESTRSYRAVQETIDFLIYQSTPALAQAKLADIERTMLAAMRRATSGTGPRPYVQCQMASDTQLWRSEILQYSFVPADDLFQSLPQGYAGFRLNIERVPYWEGTRAAIPLTNPNGTNNTTGLRISNANSYVGIAAGVIAGTMPTPLELQIQNETGAARWYSNFYIANNPYSTTLVHHIEGETVTSGGTATVVSGASGGQVARASTVGAGTIQMRWSIPAATTSILQGRYVNILARLIAAPTIRARCRVLDRLGYQVMYESPDILITGAANDGFINLGAVPLPPASHRTAFGQVTLEILFYTTASQTVNVDYITIMPSEPGNFQHFYQPGYSVPNGDIINVNGIEGLIYSNDANLDIIWKPYTEYVMLQPNVAQRLYVLIDGESSIASWQHDLLAFYRPRRLTI